MRVPAYDRPPGMFPYSSRSRRQGGFSLIEAMVAVIIMSTSLLSLALLQVLSVRASGGAYLRAQAVVLANDVVERMRANRSAALLGAYDLSGLRAVSPSGTASSTDLADWKALVGAGLPAGRGEVQVKQGTVSVRLEWMDRSKAANDDQTAAAETNSELTIRSVL